jgi:arsenate reductase (thioredoxin)
VKRVLFVCIGNACRSQMAEGFARAYGSDVIIPASAGLAPAIKVARDTKIVMAAKQIDLRDHFPKTIRHLGRSRFELVVNMSGSDIPQDQVPGAQIIEWDVEDPVFMTFEDHCKVRDQIEALVMTLIMELRREPTPPKLKGQGWAG